MSLEEAAESARNALTLGHTTQALCIWDAASTMFPDEVLPLLGKGETLCKMNLFEEAETIFLEASKRFPDNLWAHLKLALIAADRNDWDEALRRSKTIVDRFPDAAEGYISMGSAFREARRLDDADAVLETAVARFPQALWAAVHYALVAVHRQHWPEALRRWHLVRQRFPDAPNGYIGVAETNCRLGEFENADATLLAGLRSLRDSEGCVQLAETARNLERWEAAAEAWGCVRRRLPENLRSYTGESEALHRLGRIDEADSVVQLGLRRFPRNEILMVHAIRLALDDGDRPRALRRWRELKAGCPAENCDQRRERSELGKQLALSDAAFDYSTLDLDRTLTGTILSEEPLIILSAGPAFDVAEAVAPFYRGHTVYFLVGMLWTIAHYPAYAEEYQKRFRLLSEQYPTFRITVLANDVDELFALRGLGINAELVNHNAFIDERVFTILPIEKSFDAIYNARAGAHKRHELAKHIPHLKLIMSDVTCDQVASMKQVLPHAVIVNDSPDGIIHLTSKDVASHLNSSKCGLCLSKIEGAMFSSMEYLLCGLPVVTTENVGGRNWFFSNDCVLFSEDTPESVAASVEAMCRKAIAPQYVRQSALERIKRERAVFFNLVDQVFRENGQEARRSEIEFNRMFFDKINYAARPTREFLSPW